MGGARSSTLRLTADRAAVVEQALGARRRLVGSRIEVPRTHLLPRGVGQILDGACDVLVSRFAAFVGIGMLLWFPVLMIRSLMLTRGVDELLLLGWQGASGFLVQTLTVAAVCGLAGADLTGREVSVLAAVRKALLRLPGLLLFGMLAGVLVKIGSCACLVPGLLVQWLLSVVPAVYVLEALGLGGALSRGVRLVASGPALLRWLGWFFVSTAMLLPFTAIAEGLQNPLVRPGIEPWLTLPGVPYDLLAAAIGAPFLGIASAYTGVLITVYYVDQRVRREGLDLRHQLERLRVGGGEAVGA